MHSSTKNGSDHNIILKEISFGESIEMAINKCLGPPIPTSLQLFNTNSNGCEKRRDDLPTFVNGRCEVDINLLDNKYIERDDFKPKIIQSFDSHTNVAVDDHFKESFQNKNVQLPLTVIPTNNDSQKIKYPPHIATLNLISDVILSHGHPNFLNINSTTNGCNTNTAFPFNNNNNSQNNFVIKNDMITNPKIPQNHRLEKNNNGHNFDKLQSLYNERSQCKNPSFEPQTILYLGESQNLNHTNNFSSPSNAFQNFIEKAVKSAFRKECTSPTSGVAPYHKNDDLSPKDSSIMVLPDMDTIIHKGETISSASSSHENYSSDTLLSSSCSQSSNPQLNHKNEAINLSKTAPAAKRHKKDNVSNYNFENDGYSAIGLINNQDNKTSNIVQTCPYSTISLTMKDQISNLKMKKKWLDRYIVHQPVSNQNNYTNAENYIKNSSITCDRTLVESNMGKLDKLDDTIEMVIKRNSPLQCQTNRRSYHNLAENALNKNQIQIHEHDKINITTNNSAKPDNAHLPLNDIPLPTNIQLATQQNQLPSPFLQNDKCALIAPKLPKCCDCRRMTSYQNKRSTSCASSVKSVVSSQKTLEPTTFCRFMYFRKLKFNSKGVLCVAGFHETHEATANDLTLWLPDIQSNVAANGIHKTQNNSFNFKQNDVSNLITSGNNWNNTLNLLNEDKNMALYMFKHVWPHLKNVIETEESQMNTFLAYVAKCQTLGNNGTTSSTITSLNHSHSLNGEKSLLSLNSEQQHHHRNRRMAWRNIVPSKVMKGKNPIEMESSLMGATNIIVCDVCQMHIFNRHTVCGRCGFTLCLDCTTLKMAELIKKNTVSPTQCPSRVKNLKLNHIIANNGMDAAKSEWNICSNKQTHDLAKFLPTHIIPYIALTELFQMAKKIESKHPCSIQHNKMENPKLTLEGKSSPQNESKSVDPNLNGMSKTTLYQLSKLFFQKNLNKILDVSELLPKSTSQCDSNVAQDLKKQAPPNIFETPLNVLADVALNNTNHITSNGQKSTEHERENAHSFFSHLSPSNTLDEVISAVIEHSIVQSPFVTTTLTTNHAVDNQILQENATNINTSTVEKKSPPLPSSPYENIGGVLHLKYYESDDNSKEFMENFQRLWSLTQPIVLYTSVGAFEESFKSDNFLAQMEPQTMLFKQAKIYNIHQEEISFNDGKNMEDIIKKFMHNMMNSDTHQSTTTNGLTKSSQHHDLNTHQLVIHCETLITSPPFNISSYKVFSRLQNYFIGPLAKNGSINTTMFQQSTPTKTKFNGQNFDENINFDPPKTVATSKLSHNLCQYTLSDSSTQFQYIFTNGTIDNVYDDKIPWSINQTDSLYNLIHTQPLTLNQQQEKNCSIKSVNHYFTAPNNGKNSETTSIYSTNVIDHIINKMHNVCQWLAKQGIDSDQINRVIRHECNIGALWYIYGPKDALTICDYFIKNKETIIENGMGKGNEKNSFLSLISNCKDLFETKLGIRPKVIVQCRDDCVCLPIGALYQVKYITKCITLNMNFIGPEHIGHNLSMLEQIRTSHIVNAELIETSRWKSEFLQCKRNMYHAIKETCFHLNNNL